MPDLVPREDLTGAFALGSSAVEPRPRHRAGARRCRRSPLGGYTLAFAINTVSFLAVIAAIAPLRLPPPKPDTGREHPAHRSARVHGSRVGRPRHPGDPSCTWPATRCSPHRSSRSCPPWRCVCSTTAPRGRRCSSPPRGSARSSWRCCSGPSPTGSGSAGPCSATWPSCPRRSSAYAVAPSAGARHSRDLRRGGDLPGLPVGLHDDRPAAGTTRAPRPGARAR